MRFDTFLSPAEIAALQKEEAQSDKTEKRTPEQIEAIYSYGNNILVSASAGSGKTFVMVERIIDKIKRGVPIDQLFISTFTVKAATQLKERLEKKLLAALSIETQDPVRQHLSEQLADLQHADIGTMDAFAQKLVTQYGYLLGISPNFRILTDKSEQDLLKKDIFNHLFEHYYEGENAKVFIQLVSNFTGNQKDNRPFQLVIDKIYHFIQSTSDPEKWLTSSFLKGYEAFQSETDLPNYIKDKLLSKMQQAAQNLEDLTLLDDYKQVTKAGTPTVSYKKHHALFSQLYTWAAEPDSFPTLSDLAQAVSNLIPNSNEVTVKGRKYPIFKTLHSDLVSLTHLTTILEHQVEALPLLNCLRDFVLDFYKAYLERKITEGSFEFADISHFAIRILEDNPDIRKLFQNHYHEVMVDEFQDNNHTQERLLDLLSNGSNRFMVGDIKQSIYRFRQADPHIFNQKFKLFQEDPKMGQLILLKENFRSQKEVIDATNSLFSHLMDEELGDITYDDSHHLLAGSSRQKISQPEHQTEFLIYDTDSENQENQELGADLENSSMSLNEVNLVAKEIIFLHNEKGVAFDDITLLVPSRTRNDGILATFSQHGIPLVADDGKQSYLTSLEVQVMLDTLRTINNPLNDYALVALLRSPMFRFDEDDLTRLSLQIRSRPKQANFYEKIGLALAKTGEHPQLITPQLKNKLHAFDSVFQAWRTSAKILSLHDLIWKIYNDKFYYDYVGALPNGEQRQANLYALALRADGFEKTGFKGLSRFINMIDKVLESDNDLADVPVSLPKNAVQLMTIHKSKGLEFKYVFLLNMDSSFFSNRQENNSSLVISRDKGVGIKLLVDMKKDFQEQTPLPQLRVSMDTLPYQVNQREERLATLSEKMRLLYVAMTRAETKLYLIGKGSQAKLSQQFDSKSHSGLLSLDVREQLSCFQDWFLAVSEAFSQREDLHYQIRYLTAEELTTDKIGTLKQDQVIQADQLANNRQSEDIVHLLDQLEEVERLNQTYHSAIHLPTVRTPSQIKKFYQSILDDQGLDIMDEEKDHLKTGVTFDLPTLGEDSRPSSLAIGSATHELMQRIPLDQPLTIALLKKSLAHVQASPAVKAQINLNKILAFFDTELGQFIQAQHLNVRREAPFSMLVRDPASQEEFVVRGIIDGFVKETHHITLFDYKTDKYSDPQTLGSRYHNQMELYAQALRKSYDIEKVTKHLILLGGNTVEVLTLDSRPK